MKCVQCLDIDFIKTRFELLNFLILTPQSTNESKVSINKDPIYSYQLPHMY